MFHFNSVSFMCKRFICDAMERLRMSSFGSLGKFYFFSSIVKHGTGFVVFYGNHKVHNACKALTPSICFSVSSSKQGACTLLVFDQILVGPL